MGVPNPQSRRDGAIVAWHEVPGTVPSQENRPVGHGMIRAGMHIDLDDWSWSEEFLGLAAHDQTVPYGTVLVRGAVSPGTSCQATIGLSLRDCIALRRLR
jgi:hypothetical protein